MCLLNHYLFSLYKEFLNWMLEAEGLATLWKNSPTGKMLLHGKTMEPLSVGNLY